MLFPLLLAGHLLGDWVVQTDWQAATKAWTPGSVHYLRDGYIYKLPVLDRVKWWRSIRAVETHCLTYHLAMAAIVLPAWHTWGTALALVVSWVTHGFIDRRWPVRWLLRATGSPAFAEQTWGVIGADQALHIAILALIAAAAA